MTITKPFSQTYDNVLRVIIIFNCTQSKSEYYLSFFIFKWNYINHKFKYYFKYQKLILHHIKMHW